MALGVFQVQDGVASPLTIEAADLGPG